MTTLTQTGFPSLRDLTSRMDPNGGIAQIGEMLDEEMPELEDIPWVEGNLPTGHLLTNRAALPSASAVWRKINDGVSATTSRTVQFEEVCGRMEDFNKVDQALAEINGNTAAFRASEAKATVEMFAQEFARALFYESVNDNPEKIHGLSARYANATGYTSSSYVIEKGTLSGTNCHSVWLITWDPETIFGIFPKGTKAGLEQKDLGLQLVSGQTSGTQFMAYVEQFVWRCGLAVKDYRYAVRLQWDPDDTTYFDDNDTGMIDGIEQMLSTIKKVKPSTRLYMDRTSHAKLRMQLVNKSSANLLDYLTTSKGARIPMYAGVPIRVTDSLVEETALT